jgi:thioredoxin 1
MSNNIIHVSDDSFESDVLKASGPVLVDFWAEWCGPCKAIAPILEDLSAAFADKVTIAKLNVDENPMTPTRYGVRGIPTLILFKQGEAAAAKIGALPKAQLTEWISESL